MSDNGNIKWEKMLTDVLKEGKLIKRRRLIIGSSIFAFLGLLFMASVFLSQVEKKEPGEKFFADTFVEQSEIEVALISTGTFFDDDLELLIY